MFGRLFPLLILIPVIGAGVWFLFVSPAIPKPTTSVTLSPTQPVEEKTATVITTTPSKAISSIKSYAALQFRVPLDTVTVISSEKQSWDDICLGLIIPDYDCTRKTVTGYEATVKAGDNTLTYRASDDGSIVRIVKKKSGNTTSPETKE
jgi:hypothetical protein